MPEQKILGLDYSYRRIGVAVANQGSKTATPLKTLAIKNNNIPWAALRKLIDEWGASVIVVGVPTAISGKEQHTTAAAKRFIAQLENQFNLPVYPVDERLTTVEARQLLFEQGGYRGLKQSDVDSVAAQLILEQWLVTIPKSFRDARF